MLEQSLHASDILQQKYNIRLQVINLPWLNCIDKEWLRAAIQGFDYVFTVDNHYLSGGQGERITSLIVDLNLTRPPKITRFGLTQIPVCGTNAEALCYHQLDSSSLAQKISEKINGPKID
jgi:transketolase